MAIAMKITLLWDVTLYSLVYRYTLEEHAISIFRAEDISILEENVASVFNEKRLYYPEDGGSISCETLVTICQTVIFKLL
jgi:hypothetical protein